ncbi:MAG: hypothetical protein EU544_03565 [Promethearchaeota archaeon]|nr:MAG: hypothetical protein EU544_03565 [Candidatus Lokiarchaeota archaeon]
MNQKNSRLDKRLFEKIRPVLSIYLKRGFLISSKELNGDLDGFLPGEADWIIEWFKEEFESFYQENLEKHVELVNEHLDQNSEDLELLDLEYDKKRPKLQNTAENKLLLSCPACNKSIYLSDINLNSIEKGKLIDCIVYHSNGKGTEPHAVMMYLDQHLNVRGKKVIQNVSIQ